MFRIEVCLTVKPRSLWQNPLALLTFKTISPWTVAATLSPEATNVDYPPERLSRPSPPISCIHDQISGLAVHLDSPSFTYMWGLFFAFWIWSLLKEMGPVQCR